MEQIADLGCGEAFMWCGRKVKIEGIATAQPHHIKHRVRRARFVTVVEADGTEHRLHYYDDELVTVPVE